MANRIRRRLFATPADTTAETVFTNTAGEKTTLETITLSKPAGSLATDIRLTIGADGAATRFFEYPLPQGTFSITLPLNWVLSGTEILQLSSTSSDDVVLCTGNGYSESV